MKLVKFTKVCIWIVGVLFFIGSLWAIYEFTVLLAGQLHSVLALTLWVSFTAGPFAMVTLFLVWLYELVGKWEARESEKLEILNNHKNNEALIDKQVDNDLPPLARAVQRKKLEAEWAIKEFQDLKLHYTAVLTDRRRYAREERELIEGLEIRGFEDGECE